MQGHTLSNYLVIQIFFKYINIVLLMMILFISIFVKKYFKMILLIIIYELIMPEITTLCKFL